MNGLKAATTPTSGARLALFLLLSINFFNYVDRYVLAAVELPIERTLFPEGSHDKGDPEVRAQIAGAMGSLSTAFMVSYMVLAPLFGWLGDRFPRWWIVAAGVILWSLASGASGLATSFWMLFITRCFVGVGEAAYGPIAPTVIADLYPLSKRGSKLAWFYAAIPVGSACGFILGGQVARLMNDWRWAFYVVVPPGILLGLWALFMREPPRGKSDRSEESEDRGQESGISSRESVNPLDSVETGARARLPQAETIKKRRWRDYADILKTPSYVLNTLGMTAMTFALGGMAFWMPTYIAEDRTSPVPACSAALVATMGTGFGQGPLIALAAPFAQAEQDSSNHARVTSIFGIIVVASGFGGTLLGGWVGDKLRNTIKGSYFVVSGMAMLLSFPLILLFLWTPFPLAWWFVFFACVCLFFNNGPTNTILANVTRPSVRATAFALNIFVLHTFGDAISPMIVGWIRGYFNMTIGFLVISAATLIAGVFWLMGAPFLARDTEKVIVQDR